MQPMIRRGARWGIKRPTWSGSGAGRWLGFGLGVWGLVAVSGAQACGSPTAPERAEDVRIELGVSGGFAGVDWQITIDGRAGWIVGDRCRGNLDCDWEAGELLATVDAARILELARRFIDVGFLELRQTDFGTECCDQFGYQLTYADDDDRRTVHGSDGTLPSSVLTLIEDVRRFLSESRSAP